MGTYCVIATQHEVLAAWKAAGIVPTEGAGWLVQQTNVTERCNVVLHSEVDSVIQISISMPNETCAEYPPM